MGLTIHDSLAPANSHHSAIVITCERTVSYAFTPSSEADLALPVQGTSDEVGQIGFLQDILLDAISVETGGRILRAYLSCHY